MRLIVKLIFLGVPVRSTKVHSWFRGKLAGSYSSLLQHIPWILLQSLLDKKSEKIIFPSNSFWENWLSTSNPLLIIENLPSLLIKTTAVPACSNNVRYFCSDTCNSYVRSLTCLSRLWV